MSEYDPKDAFGLIRSFTRHVSFVRLALAAVCHELERRALRHDMSKMLDDEFSGFARINAAARINKFGSPEYSESMKQERTTIDLHFSRNSHHPEFYAEPLSHEAMLNLEAAAAQMTFLDIIEMVCDWRGAQLGYDDPRPWLDTVELNVKSKGLLLSPEQRWLVGQVAQFIAANEKATAPYV